MPHKNTIDVFNGDADGLLARHQFRLTYPVALEQVTLVSGVKRDIALLGHVVKMQSVPCEDNIQVFDISYDRNAVAVDALLATGARITYFDHHRASRLRSQPHLTACIDESPDTCTSLLVDRHCSGAHRLWAIAAAFGDNLSAVARRLSRDANLLPAQEAQLRLLGECINYNAYGESVEDLHYPPATLAVLLAPYASPFDFIEHEDVLSRLKTGYESDMAKALALNALQASNVAAIFLMPDASWARRVSGAFANHLVHAFPDRAHAVLTTNGRVRRRSVFVRPPRSPGMPRKWPPGLPTVAVARSRRESSCFRSINWRRCLLNWKKLTVEGAGIRNKVLAARTRTGKHSYLGAIQSDVDFGSSLFQGWLGRI